MTPENHKKWLLSTIACGHIVDIPFITFDKINIVARGTFGEISRAYWKSGEKEVALKTRHDSPNKNSFDDFIRELHLIRSVDFHDNIIRFYGVSEDPVTRRYFMVLQYANGGNLRDFLCKNHEFLSWETKINIAIQVSSGLKCIHERNIIHRDLHSKNILVHDGKMIITDFGLSKSLKDDFGLAENNETYISEEMIGYIEPKCFENPAYKRNKASDIYSLGVLLWEISSGKPPFKDMRPLEIAYKVAHGKREVPTIDSPPDYVKIYQMAWDYDPGKRPTINKFRDCLEGLSSKLQRNLNNTREYMQPPPQYPTQTQTQTQTQPHVPPQPYPNEPYQFDQPQSPPPSPYYPRQSQYLFNYPPQNPQCASIIKKYIEEFQNTSNYVEPTKCHAGYHAGIGDVAGLEWHLLYDNRIDETYNFSSMTDNLVLITASFCERKNINAMFKCLNERGADFNVITKKTEKTVFHLLYNNSTLCNKITHTQEKLYEYQEVLIQAIKFFKKIGCDINAKDRNGRTVLSYYLEEKSLHQEKKPIIQALLKNGADPNIQVTLAWGFDAKTALFQAVKNKWPNDVLELICKHGVDIKAVNNADMNALAVATRDKNLTIMTWMLENLSRVSEKDSIKIAKKFAGSFTTKEYQLLNKRCHRVLSNNLSNYTESDSDDSENSDDGE